MRIGILLILLIMPLGILSCQHPAPVKKRDDPPQIWCRQLCGEHGVLKFDAIMKQCFCHKRASNEVHMEMQKVRADNGSQQASEGNREGADELQTLRSY